MHSAARIHSMISRASKYPTAGEVITQLPLWNLTTVTRNLLMEELYRGLNERGGGNLVR